MAEHSRPVYRVLDHAKLAKGNNPETPDHVTAEIVKDRLDYVAACKLAATLNAKPGAQKVLKISKELEALEIESFADLKAARKRINRAAYLLRAGQAFHEGDVSGGNEMMRYAKVYA